jgi:superoxide dismutase, Cu-Zn family
MRRQFFVWHIVAIVEILPTCLMSYAAAQQSGVTVELKNAEGDSVGTATLSTAGRGVRIKLDLNKLPAGEHALHIHQMAKCEAPGYVKRDMSGS